MPTPIDEALMDGGIFSISRVGIDPKKKKCGCCDRGDEYNGFASGPLLFVCPESCPCHD